MDELSSLINDYKQNKMNEDIKYLKEFERMNFKTFDSFLKVALSSFPIHKWFVKVNEEALDAIRQVYNYIRINEETLKKMNRFNDIIFFVNSANIKNFGELSIYDTSVALGIYLGHMPTHVFLHAGPKIAVEKIFGANYKHKVHFLKDNKRLMYIEASDLPTEFHELAPYIIEDCLCYIHSKL